MKFEEEYQKLLGFIINLFMLSDDLTTKLMFNRNLVVISKLLCKKKRIYHVGTKMTPFTESQIANLNIDEGKPLLIVDADEVIVLFAEHFSKYLTKKGWQLNLTGYRLDDAIRHLHEGYIADKITYQKLIDDFIKVETLTQPEAPGAAQTLKLLSHKWQIVILTNVPTSSRADRILNLSELGMSYPLVSNSGVKGAAIKMLSGKTTQKVIFIDDNPHQIRSAATSSPHIYRFHFSACKLVKKTMPFTEFATHRPESWEEIKQIITSISI